MVRVGRLPLSRPISKERRPDFQWPARGNTNSRRSLPGCAWMAAHTITDRSCEGGVMCRRSELSLSCDPLPAVLQGAVLRSGGSQSPTSRIAVWSALRALRLQLTSNDSIERAPECRPAKARLLLPEPFRWRSAVSGKLTCPGALEIPTSPADSVLRIQLARPVPANYNDGHLGSFRLQGTKYGGWYFS